MATSCVLYHTEAIGNPVMTETVSGADVTEGRMQPYTKATYTMHT